MKTPHQIYKMLITGKKVKPDDLHLAFLDLYNLYQHVSSDRINYINLWEQVPVEDRMKIHEKNQPF